VPRRHLLVGNHRYFAATIVKLTEHRSERVDD
jgi:hypothetical protein